MTDKTPIGPSLDKYHADAMERNYTANNQRVAQLRYALKIALEAMEIAYDVMEDGHQAYSKSLVQRAIHRSRETLVGEGVRE